MTICQKVMTVAIGATIPVISPISNPYSVAVVEAVVLATANRICYHVDNFYKIMFYLFFVEQTFNVINFNSRLSDNEGEF